MKKGVPINKIICGNCLEVMKDLPANSVDAIVTGAGTISVSKKSVSM